MESPVYTIRVISEKCTGCALCIKECPIHAMKLIEVGGKKEIVIKEGCIYCGACMSKCRFKVIELVEGTVRIERE